MYEYRNVYEKLSLKISRTYRHMPELDYTKSRVVTNKDAAKLRLGDARIFTIITSPPYMKSLTYARDNRMRLWFLGVENWQEIDKIISPTRSSFLELMIKSIQKWSNNQISGDKCIMIVGDIKTKYRDVEMSMGDALIDIASKKYNFIEAFEDLIPESRKVVKGNTSIKKEHIIVLERK